MFIVLLQNRQEPDSGGNRLVCKSATSRQDTGRSEVIVVRLSIGAKILLGMAAILLVGLVSMLTIFQGLFTVQDAMHQVVNRNAPTTGAAVGLALAVEDAGFRVLRYLRTGDEASRESARQGLEVFRQAHKKFSDHAVSEEERTLARELEALAVRYEETAHRLLGRRTRLDTLSAQGDQLLGEMSTIVNDRLQVGINMNAPDALEKDTCTKAVAASLDGLTAWLKKYLVDPQPRFEDRIEDALAQIDLNLTRYGYLRLNAKERHWSGELQKRYRRFHGFFRQDRGLQMSITNDSEEFIGIRSEMATNLNGEINRLLGRNLGAAREQADRAFAGVERLISFLIPLFILCGIGLAVLITRVVTEPVRKLMAGTTAVREGDLSHVIVHKSRDEFAALADNFNRMVEQLRQTTVSRDRLETSEQQLLRLNTELEVASRRKNEFLAMLGHELRNPLGAISNAVELMRRRSPETTAVRRPLDVLNRQVGHMNRLVDDLLDVSRITRGKIELRRCDMDLLPLVEDAVHAVRPLIQARGHRLHIALPPSPVLLHGDPTRLEQVLVNLLSNAAKYTEPGGEIWLTVAVEDSPAAEGKNGTMVPSRAVAGSAEVPSPAVSIRIRDNGIGIEQEMLPLVFELFTQSERALDRSQGGLGIGLTLVRGLVEMHGGSIRVHSEGTGLGSEFVVTLPLVRSADPNSMASCRVIRSRQGGAAGLRESRVGTADPQETRSATDPTTTADPALPGMAVSDRIVGVPGRVSPCAWSSSGDPSGKPRPGTRCVLVVDDNLDAAESLKEILEEWDCAVRLAHDGPQALDAARAFAPDVILLDIGLPGLDGYEVARRLRQESPAGEKAPHPEHSSPGRPCLIAITGYGQEEDLRRSREAGFDHHLVKPVDLEQLAKLLAGQGLRSGQNCAIRR